MTIDDILDFLYPIDLYNGNIILQDDGQGTYIKHWNVSNTEQPNLDFLMQDADFYKSAIEEAKVKKAYNEAIKTQLELIDIKSIRAIRSGDNERLRDLENEAIILRSKFR